LHSGEKVVAAVIGRRVAIPGAAPPLQDQIAVIEAAAVNWRARTARIRTYLVGGDTRGHVGLRITKPNLL
jgi:hypothetical protein